MLKNVLAGCGVVALLGLIVFDSRIHFDPQLVQAKLKHNSDQKNWSLFYGQQQVFNHSPFRYHADLQAIKQVLEPNNVVLSDLATSYFIAATLPVYVVNTHRHQGRRNRPEWRHFLGKRYFCYMEFAENRQQVRNFLAADNVVKYVIVNRDSVFKHRRRDCLAFRGQTLTEKLPEIADKISVGRYLDLYRLRS